jgi:hypothetical protein
LVSTSHGAGGYLSSSVRFSKDDFINVPTQYCVFTFYVIGSINKMLLASVRCFFKPKYKSGYSFRKNTNHGIEVIFSLLNTGVCDLLHHHETKHRGENDCHSSVIVQLVYHVLQQNQLY